MGVDSQFVPDQATERARAIDSVKQRFPIVTFLECGVCVFLYLAIQLFSTNFTWDDLAKWGYLSSIRIWDGAYWGLLSGAFIHVALWHLAFNVYWLWKLGGALERYVGPWKMLLFTLAAAFISSSAQLAISGGTGYGASGIVYAIFGFLWIGRKKVQQFDHVLGTQTVPLFLIWLVACIVVTFLGILQIGNAAHVSGVCFGMLVGYIAFPNRLRKPAMLLAILMIIASTITLFWSPWSASWVGYKGFKAHESHEFKLAVSLYRRSIELGGDRKWALSNIALARYAQGDSAGYSAALTELSKIDSKAAHEVEKKIGVSGSPGKK